MKRFSIHFSAYHPMLEDQLKDQGLKFSIPEDAKKFQRFADSITNLRISSILTTAEAENANRRIMKQLTKAVTER